MNKILKIVPLLLITLLFTGCQNYQEINNYAIVSGISIDKSNNDKNMYTVGIQIMNAKKDEESDNSLITFYKSDGNTIFEALQKIMLDSPKELYLGHNEVVVISEELLKEKSPLNYLDYFMRHSKVEKDSFVMIAKDDNAYEILKIITPLETIPSRNLKATLSVSDQFSGTLTIVTIDEFISDLEAKGIEATLPSVSITGKKDDGDKMDNIKSSDPEAKLKFGTLGYFKDNKLIGYLTSNESLGFNFLADTPHQTYVNTKCDDKNYASILVDKSKLKEKLYFKEKSPKAKITIEIEASLLEYNCKADFISDEKVIKKLEKKAASKIKKVLEKTVDKLYKKEKTDVLKYGAKFYEQKYKEMKKYNLNKSDIASKITFDFDVKVKITSTELSVRSVKENNDE